jgi:hypothetical protein
MSDPRQTLVPADQWLRLISAYLDQSIEDEEFDLLSEWITSSHDHALWFAGIAFVHSSLRATVLDQELREFIAAKDADNSLRLAIDPLNILEGLSESDERKQLLRAREAGARGNRLVTEATKQPQSALRVMFNRAAARAEPGRRSVWEFASVAAAVALGAVVSFFATMRLSSERQALELVDRSTIAPSNIAAVSGYVATLGEMRNCVWESGEQDLASGHPFTSGSKLRVASGLAQVSFETGAVSVVEGPAVFTLLENAMELDRGEVSTLLPEAASGFRVLTPSSEVVDLGTSFGVKVDDRGGSQVHVFEGEAVTRQRNAAGEAIGEQFYVTTNNAIRFGPNSEQYERLVADEDSFARILADGRGEDFMTEPVVDKPLLLWLTSGHWIVDKEQRVTVWRDTPSSTNTIPDNALQAAPSARPTVVKGVFNGHDVLRFDGDDDFLVTTPFHSSNSQTVAFVASINATSQLLSQDRRWTPQIINYNGPPQIDANLGPAPNFLEISATAYDADRIALDAYVYSGYKFQSPPQGKYHIFAGEVSTEFPGDPVRMQVDPMPAVGTPFVGTYVYNYVNDSPEHCIARLWINGQVAGWTSAPAPIAMTSRKVIGRHGGHPLQFCGDIAEVMIYDQALDTSEVATLTESLAEKYGIALSTAARPEPSQQLSDSPSFSAP